MTWPHSDLSRRSNAKTEPPHRSIWTKVEIRRARHIPLKPVLEKLGYRLLPRPNGNYIVTGLAQEVVVKDHYWVCTEDGSAGNCIDFLIKFAGMSFSKSMELLRS